MPRSSLANRNVGDKTKRGGTRNRKSWRSQSQLSSSSRKEKKKFRITSIPGSESKRRVACPPGGRGGKGRARKERRRGGVSRVLWRVVPLLRLVSSSFGAVGGGPFGPWRKGGCLPAGRCRGVDERCELGAGQRNMERSHCTAPPVARSRLVASTKQADLSLARGTRESLQTLVFPLPRRQQEPGHKTRQNRASDTPRTCLAVPQDHPPCTVQRESQ